LKQSTISAIARWNTVQHTHCEMDDFEKCSLLIPETLLETTC